VVLVGVLACQGDGSGLESESELLFAQCPCPIESYCDLATGTCVPGCIEDAGCRSGRWCDTAARQCRDGCRADIDCGERRICENHACVVGCRRCPSATQCTRFVCEEGACVERNKPNGTDCRFDNNECTDDECKDGVCKPYPESNGTPCGERDDECYGAECRSWFVRCTESSGGLHDVVVRQANGSTDLWEDRFCACVVGTNRLRFSSYEVECAKCETINQGEQYTCWM
jgi:hypothetical protein